MSDEKKDDADKGPLDGLLQQGRGLLANLQGQAEAQLKQEAERAGEMAQGIAQQVIGGAKVSAGTAFGQAGLVEQGRADEVAGQQRKTKSGAAEPLQQAGDAVTERLRDTVDGLVDTARRKFSGPADGKQQKD